MEREYYYADGAIRGNLAFLSGSEAGGTRNYFPRTANKISAKITTGIIKSMV
jgi:hypothetical protein